MAAEKLRDLSQPIDVAVLDATVSAFFVTGSKEEVVQFIPCSSENWMDFSLILRVVVSIGLSEFDLVAH